MHRYQTSSDLQHDIAKGCRVGRSAPHKWLPHHCCAQAAAVSSRSKSRHRGGRMQGRAKGLFRRISGWTRKIAVAAPRAHRLDQVPSLEQFHRKEPHLALGEQFMKRDEVRMRNPCEAAELLFEQEQRIRAQVKEGFERDGDVAVPIMSFIHHSHPAFAQLAADDKAGISLEYRGHRQTKLSLCGWR